MNTGLYTRKEEVRLRAKARYARAWSLLMSLIRMREATRGKGSPSSTRPPFSANRHLGGQARG